MIHHSHIRKIKNYFKCDNNKVSKIQSTSTSKLKNKYIYVEQKSLSQKSISSKQLKSQKIAKLCFLSLSLSLFLLFDHYKSSKIHVLLKITRNKEKKRIRGSKHSNRSKNLLYRSHKTGYQIFNCCNECSFTRKFFPGESGICFENKEQTYIVN